MELSVSLDRRGLDDDEPGSMLNSMSRIVFTLFISRGSSRCAHAGPRSYVVTSL